MKLIGHTERIDGKIYAAVSPYFVPASTPLSHVDGVFNGILVDANMLGRALFYGAGAGKLPTASAVVADIIDILSAESLAKTTNFIKSLSDKVLNAAFFPIDRKMPQNMVDKLDKYLLKKKDNK